MRAAVVGLGWWGKQITKSLAGSERVRVTHAIDTALTGHNEFAAQHGLKLTDDFDAALADQAIDAMIIATPNSLHEEMLLKSVAAGKQVFCEKPLALTVESAQRMIGACDKAGIVLGMGHERRWEPAMEELRRLVESGAIGKVLQAETNFSHSIFTNLDLNNWRFDPSESPGAGYTGRGIHLTDFFISLLGQPRTVWATTGSISLAPPRADTLAVHITFQSGVSALLGVLTTTPFYGRFTVYGDKGWVEAREVNNIEHDDPAELTICRADGTRETTEYPVADTVRTNFEAWADAVEGKRPYRIKPDEILANIKVFEAIVTSARTGEPVHLS